MSIGARRLLRAIQIPVTPIDQSPVSDAGSKPVGTANYAVPPGATYMSTSGNDTSGTGGANAPYRSLAQAISATASGGTIVIRGGSYNEGEDTQDQSYPKGIIVQKVLTIQNYPGEAVWFDGSVPVTGNWTQNGATWNTPYNQIFDRSPSTNHGVADGAGASTGAGGWYLSSSHPEACWPDMVLFDGVQLTQVTSLNDVAPGKFYIEGATTTDDYWFQGTKLHIGNNPAGHEVCYANKCKFMTITGSSANVTVRGIGIRRYASYQGGLGTIYAGGTTTLENVWIEDLSCSFISTAGSSNDVMRKLTGRRIGFNFIGGNQCDDLLIDRIDVQQSNYRNWNLYGPAVGIIKVTKAQRLTLRNSIISNNNSTVFWTDQTVASPRVINCLMQNNTYRVIDFETSSDAIMANCKVINNGSFSVYTNDSDSTQVWNCTFAENGWGVTGTGANNGNGTSTSVPTFKFGQSPRRYDVSTYSYCIDPRQPSSYYTDYPEHQWTINSFTICNNVVAKAGVNTYSMIIVENGGDSTRPNNSFATMSTTIDGNVYHWGSDKPSYPWALGKGYNNGYDIYQTFAAYQSAKNKDLNSTFATNNPLDNNYDLIDTSLHAKSVALPAKIATLIGQTAGSKRTGCFW